MLRLSRRTDYAVRVMLVVASVPEGVHIPTAQVGEQMLIPQPFLVKVIGDLKRAGLVTTTAGRGGGLRIMRPAETITLRHIVEAVEGPISLNFCLMRPGECEFDQICPVHPVWQHIQGVLNQELDAVNLATLSNVSVEIGYLNQQQALSDGDKSL